MRMEKPGVLRRVSFCLCPARVIAETGTDHDDETVQLQVSPIRGLSQFPTFNEIVSPYLIFHVPM